jgi:hypothetical protein
MLCCGASIQTQPSIGRPRGAPALPWLPHHRAGGNFYAFTLDKERYMTVDLSHLEDDFTGAEEQKAKAFDELPDGKYLVEVMAAEVTTSKAGSPMLAWSFEIRSGPHDGRKMWRNSMLSSKANLGWLKTDLARCGMTLAKVNDLNDRAHELVGLCLHVTQKTNGTYKNVYIDGLATETEVADLTGPAIDKNDALPF